MAYRAETEEEFSNTYHFGTSPPGDDASWTVLMNDVLNQERNIFPATVHFVRAYGYNDDADNAQAVFHHDWTVPGPPPTGALVPPTATPFAGDQAALVWWRLDKKNSRGKWIYLRKYLHHGYATTANPDQVDATYGAALGTYVSNLANVSFHGAIRPRKYTANITGYQASPWVTTRTLKRRGKRPRTAP